jgi:alpha-beta hydrolase superfamily lysophospholipase
VRALRGGTHPGKKLRVYPGVYHEPHNDLGHEQVVADIKEWLERVTGNGAPAR